MASGRAQFAWPVPGFPRLDEDADKKGAYAIDMESVADGGPVLHNFCLVAGPSRNCPNRPSIHFAEHNHLSNTSPI
jgi:hypothetical protein